MATDALQHINIHTHDLERSRDFYTRIIGLTVGHRPPFVSVGYWMYLGTHPVIHLVQTATVGVPPPGSSGAIDHIAFGGVDLDGTRNTMRAEGLQFREVVVPGDNTIQLFVHDPDGIKIELNFRAPQT